MDREELERETLAVFGGRRVTEGIAGRLESAPDAALEGGRLTGTVTVTAA